MIYPYFSEIENSGAEFFIHHILTGHIKTDVHQHTSAQLIYGEGGILHIFVEEKHWYLPARCFMWIPANVPHYVFTQSPKVSLYNFYFKTVDKENPFFKEINIYSVSNLLREMIHYTKFWNGNIYQTDYSKYIFLKALMEVLPNEKSLEGAFAVQHPFPKEEILMKISEYLNANLDKSLSIEETAREFGMSERTLSRKFKESLGMNYVRFVRSLRITKALEMIQEEKYNMYEIAMQVGYHSLSAFSNIFKKVLGVSPTEYTQRLKQQNET